MNSDDKVTCDITSPPRNTSGNSELMGLILGDMYSVLFMRFSEYLCVSLLIWSGKGRIVWLCRLLSV